VIALCKTWFDSVAPLATTSVTTRSLYKSYPACASARNCQYFQVPMAA